MQALEWAIRFPDRVDEVLAIGAAPLGSLGLALNHIQRQALSIAADPREGLRLARAIAMCTYKSAELFDERHGRRPNRRGPAPWQSSDGLFDIAGYLDHQGGLFDGRFDPHSYTAITRAMDLWDPEREFGADAFSRITARVSLVGISSDWLFPAADIHALAHNLREAGVDAPYHEIHSPHGHDSFLAEPEHIITLLDEILSTPTRLAHHPQAHTTSVSGHDYSRADPSTPFPCHSERSTLACAAEESQHSPG